MQRVRSGPVCRDPAFRFEPRTLPLDLATMRCRTMRTFGTMRAGRITEVVLTARSASNMPGYVHVYTGNGKGKTTAAMGLALRAAGAGWDVFIAQFGKPSPSSEVQALERFADRITVRHYGYARSEHGLAECKEVLASGDYGLVVLDEANVGPKLQMFAVEQLLGLLDARQEHVELVVTGRDAAPAVIERADLVTEMREVKHYYQQGVLARVGIEQ
jgi:cob(I)alamin adenosyltransferase